MSRRYLELVKVLNMRLNHFPAYEQKGLALVIREKAYSLCDYMVETQKNFHKKTPINKLDVAHEQMRMHLHTAMEQGYFGHPEKPGKTKEELNRDRHESLSVLVDGFGEMIGGWKKKIKADEDRARKEAASKKQEAQ